MSYLIITKTWTALVAIGVIDDLEFLILDAVDLSKLNKRQLCSEAEKLQNVIERMQDKRCNEKCILDQFKANFIQLKIRRSAARNFFQR